MNEQIQNIFDTFITNEGKEIFGSVFNFIINLFTYIFDLFLYEFLDVVFDVFDGDRLVKTGSITTDSLFHFTGQSLSDVITNNFFFFVIGLFATAFVFKFLWNLFVDVFKFLAELL